MWFTVHERKILNILLKNARYSDAHISTQLGISSQAVGKIRKKLEDDGIIEGYTIKMAPENLKLTLNVYYRFHILGSQNDKIANGIINTLEKTPNIIRIAKCVANPGEYLAQGIYKNIEEFNERVKNLEKADFFKNIRTIKTDIVPTKNIIKDSKWELFSKTINTPKTRRGFI